MATPAASTGNRAMRLPGTCGKTGLKKTQIYELIAKGEFPKPIKIGARSVAWLEREVDEWLADRIRDRDAEAA